MKNLIYVILLISCTTPDTSSEICSEDFAKIAIADGRKGHDRLYFYQNLCRQYGFTDEKRAIYQENFKHSFNLNYCSIERGIEFGKKNEELPSCSKIASFKKGFKQGQELWKDQNCTYETALKLGFNGDSISPLCENAKYSEDMQLGLTTGKENWIKEICSHSKGIEDGYLGNKRECPPKYQYDYNYGRKLGITKWNSYNCTFNKGYEKGLVNLDNFPERCQGTFLEDYKDGFAKGKALWLNRNCSYDAGYNKGLIEAPKTACPSSHVAVYNEGYKEGLGARAIKLEIEMMKDAVDLAGLEMKESLDNKFKLLEEENNKSKKIDKASP